MHSRAVTPEAQAHVADARSTLRRLCSAAVCVACMLGTSSCSIQKMAAGGMANAIANGPDVYASDDDPELVRDAVPFGLKTMESLLEVVPKHRGLLLATCRGFTQYAYAFVQIDADAIEPVDYQQAKAMRRRALRLYERGLRYGLRGLERDYPGITEQLHLDPEAAAQRISVKHVSILYWTAAAWGSAISLGKDQPELLADLPAVRALMARGLTLDEGYDGGAFHEAMIVLEALPPAMGGSPARAREHFRRALELSHGEKAGPYVSLAESVSIMEQSRGEFEDLLHHALEIDPGRIPSQRLANLILQRKARTMLARVDDYFIEPAPDSEVKP